MNSPTALIRDNGFQQDNCKIHFAMRKSAVSTIGVLILLAMLLSPVQLAAQEAKFDSDTISGLGARNIGSAAMSGRVSALTAVKEDGRLTVYIGAASGGIWKSVNGGTTFKPVFDKPAVQSRRICRARYWRPGTPK